jgi:hypothetical protein
VPGLIIADNLTVFHKSYVAKLPNTSVRARKYLNNEPEYVSKVKTHILIVLRYSQSNNGIMAHSR